ncbi:MAG TPA: hypothetical protein VF457_01030 [Burkholderiaceae bacterium]
MSNDQEISPAHREALAERRLTLVLGGLACVLGIVLLILPWHPMTAVGWLIYLLALSLFVVFFFGLSQCLRYLEKRSRHNFINRALGLFIAVVPGLVLIYLLFSHADFVMHYVQ